MYQASESEDVKSVSRCIDCLKIHLNPPHQAPMLANHTDWPTFSRAASVSFSRAASVSNTHGSEEEHTELKTAFDTFMLYFTSIMKQKVNGNGNSRKRRQIKRKENRNQLANTDYYLNKEVMSQEPVTEEAVTSNTSGKSGSVSVEPARRTKFNQQNTLDMIEKREESNLWNEHYFYADISRQKSIEILRTEGKEKQFVLRERYRKNAPFEICLLHNKHNFYSKKFANRKLSFRHTRGILHK